MKPTVLILAAALILAGCGGGSSGSSKKGKGGGSLLLEVTEVGLNPAIGGTWIEIHNLDAKSAGLAGVTIAASSGGEVVLPSTSPDLPAGGYLAVGIGLPAGPGRVEVLSRSGRIVATASWPSLSPSSVALLAGTSYGVTTAGAWRVLGTPTPGAPNVDPDSPVLFNEVCADNDEDFENPDAPGEYDDWIELHNPGATDADVSGMTLTNDPSDPTRWTLPIGTAVPAGGFLLIHADDRALSGLHASFRLPAEDGVVCLFAADGTLADTYAWDQMGEDRSRGRDEDGRAGWVAWRELTPGASNANGLRDRTDDPAHRKRTPDYDRVFDPSVVKELRIEIRPGDFERMKQNRDHQIEKNPADPDFKYYECTVRFEGDVWEHVGVRHKGASSSHYPWKNGFKKYPLKFDFDEFEDDWPEWKNQRFHGMKKLTLSNGVADPTYLREILCLMLMRENGVTASRVAPLAVFVDTGGGPRYWGLYMSVEQVDGTFLKDRYGDDDGNLYKPEGPGASLERFVRGDFEKKSNEDEEDWSDVIRLIEVLDATYPDLAAQKAAILEVFDVESFLPWLAVNAVLTNFDSYMALNHNYYLYRHHDDGRFRFITWDHNQAFGSPANIFRAKDAAEWDIFDPAYGYRPLISRILEIPEWRESYLDRVKAFRDGPFARVAFEKRVDEFHALLRPWVVGTTGEVAPYTLLADPDHFDRGLTEKLTPIGWVPIPALLNFATERRAYLDKVLD